VIHGCVSCGLKYPSGIIRAHLNKVHSITCHEGNDGELYSFFNLDDRLREWSTLRSGRFTPGERDPASIVQEAG
jgi:hypothetical protein